MSNRAAAKIKVPLWRTLSESARIDVQRNFRRYRIVRP
jgi:hypothetical protein